ncbi:MAG TPA: DUF4199 domain-containing protein [Chitinophagales bacterium]|nr:DUF4199 domain-containing protein [Chitinophagales bacterium]
MSIGTELRYAFYTAAFSFIWLMLEYVVGLHDRLIDYHPVITLFAVFIPIVTYYLGLRKKRDVDYDGTITLGQCFKAGMIMTVVLALLTVLFQVAFHYLINPAFFDNMISHAVERATRNGQDTNKAFKDARANFNLRSYMLQSGIGMLVFGALLTGIYSFALSRKGRVPNRPITPVDVIAP